MKFKNLDGWKNLPFDFQFVFSDATERNYPDDPKSGRYRFLSIGLV